MIQYDRLRQSHLLGSKNQSKYNFNFSVVSIGTPQTAKEVCNHLELHDAEEWIYCDPDSETYELLQLNAGIQTLIAPATSFAFRDRIFGLNGRGDTSTGKLNDLFTVLKKWNSAVYVPPKFEQAFQQGGAFIFRDPEETLLAHYDASTGAHLDPGIVFNKANEFV